MNIFKAIGSIKTPFHRFPSPAKPLTHEQVIESQAKELKEHAATGQPMTYVPEPEAVKAAKVTVTPIPEALPTETPTVSVSVAPEAILHAPTGILSSYPAAKVIVQPEVPIHTASYAALAAQPEKETTVSTAPVVTSTSQPNEFVKILKAIGHFFAKVIPVAAAIESAPAVQQLENITLGPTIAGLIEKWINTAATVEASSAAAATSASAPGLTDSQKAQIVISSLYGDAQQVATQLGASALTVADLKIFNDAAIAIAGVFKVAMPAGSVTAS